jgi:nucleoside-diphosphate-sugar epimerase
MGTARRVFVAGATGVIGRYLVPMLRASGHAVTGTTRSEAHARWLASVGADVAIVDAFDAAALRGAVATARPDVIVHQLTDLSAGFGPEQLRATSRLREVGTRNLVDAAQATGTARFVAQSVAWLYAPGPLPHTEADPLWRPAERPDDVVLGGVVALERMVTTAAAFEGLVLRYGYLHGPGTGAERPERTPSVHVEAAARAAALAVERGAAGVYNIVDDDAELSNVKARRLLGWRPRRRSGEGGT